jgi:K+-sensing histidine kinase KdpD
MRNDVELFIAKHGSYFLIALLAVIIKALYTKESQSVKSVLRSLLSALVISYIFVEKVGSFYDQPTIFIYVFVGSILSDVIIEAILALSDKIKKDPDLLLNLAAKFIPWLKK